MRRFLIRLAIGLIAFIVGVTAATLLGGLFGLRTVKHRCEGSAAFVPPPPPVMTHSCPAMHRFDIPAPPAAPEPPAPPAAPAPPQTVKKMQIQVRSDDGTVKVIEVQREKSEEK